MESPYDSDMSEDIRDLVERGLATYRRKRDSRAEQTNAESVCAPNRDMDIPSVQHPLVLAGVSLTHGLAPMSSELLVGAGRNI